VRVSPVSFSMVLVAWLSLGAFVQDPQQDPQPKAPDRKTQDPKTGLGPGPGWRGPVRPSGRNEVFATGDGCAMCHSNAKNALAMRTATSEEVSPHKLWQASVMANSFLDPYWRAQVEKEMAADPEKAPKTCRLSACAATRRWCTTVAASPDRGRLPWPTPRPIRWRAMAFRARCAIRSRPKGLAPKRRSRASRRSNVVAASSVRTRARGDANAEHGQLPARAWGPRAEFGAVCVLPYAAHGACWCEVPRADAVPRMAQQHLPG
jgi:hypothetical protein